MFGLEDISHWQFARTILIGLLAYYIILLLYLALKNTRKQEQASFEAEAMQDKGEIKAKTIKAEDFPSTSSTYIESDENDLKVYMDKEPDYSGYVLDALDNTQMEDKEAFLNNIEYELQPG